MSSETVVVNTRNGRLRGKVLRSFEGYDYCAFKGIPYAKPPVGELRFKDPLTAEPWSGILDATEYGQVCAQRDLVTRTTQGGDDCLYLNVYARSVKATNQLPVMVWIHGGAFIHGSGDDFLYGPDFFLRKDIVLVTFNYRLGVLGFLDFNDEVAAGNQGLKDQLMALKWVKQNIANFGGDSNNVTIFGESAGGASVHFLALSPLTKGSGLFNKAICQSGVACTSWACSSSKQNAYNLCRALGNNSSDPKTLVEFLRTIDCDRLLRAQDEIRSNELRLLCLYPFGPGVDDKSKEPIVPIHPLKANEKAVDIPIILGNNTREAIFCLPGLKPQDYDEIDRNFERYLRPTIKELANRNNLTANDLKKLYFGDEKVSIERCEKFVDAWSDWHFVDGVHRVVKSQIENSPAPIYYYNFTYDKEFSITKTYANTTMPGTSHFDEVQFQFSMRLYDVLNVERPKPGTTAYRISEQIIEMWVNFAKFGKPTPVLSDLLTTYWVPATNAKHFETLNIDEVLQMSSTLHIDERLSFGKKMKNKL